MITSVKVHFDILPYIASSIWRISHQTICTKASFRFPTMTCPLNNLTWSNNRMVEQGFETLHKMTTTWKASWGLSQWEFHDIPTTPISFHAFLTKEWDYI